MISLSKAIPGNEPNTARFKIRLSGIKGIECTIRHASNRGGVVGQKVFIGKK
jgi:hypothetical protein